MDKQIIRMGKFGSVFQYETSKNNCFVCYSHKTNKKGYPVFNYKGRPIHIHRYLFLIKYGNIPHGLIIRHKCDNRKCINLDHLEIGTSKDNSQDMVTRGRSTFGSKNPMAKLNEEQVKFIKTSNLPNKTLANEFNVKRGCIVKIKNGDRWKHV